VATTSHDPVGPDPDRREGSGLSNNPTPQRPVGAPVFKFECAACGTVADDASSPSEAEAIRWIEAKGWSGRGDPALPYKMRWFCPKCAGRT
jgi:hypothetical protein